jgi:PHS family inorganic phosphate transporter-like MFS transporter
MSTAYNLDNMSIGLVLLKARGLDPSPFAQSALTSVAFAGAIIGQLTFGYVGDCLGRGKAMQLTMALSILGALLESTSWAPEHNDEDRGSVAIFAQLILWRFILGVGVGGVYPLAATVAAESSSDSAKSGRNSSFVFSFQGLGQVLVPLVALFAWNVVARSNAGSGPGGDWDWRLLFGFGAVPGILLLPFKTVDKKHIMVRQGSGDQSKGDENDEEGAVRSSSLHSGKVSQTNEGLVLEGGLERPLLTPSSHEDLSLWTKVWNDRRDLVPKLIGTAGGWFIFDVTFYANALFAPAVLAALFTPSTSTADGALTSTPAPTPYDFNLTHKYGVDDNILHTLITYSIGLPGFFYFLSS